jgi:hypothetical protein
MGDYHRTALKTNGEEVEEIEEITEPKAHVSV